MAIVHFIPVLISRIDDAMTDVPHHCQRALAPSELVAIGFPYAIKGVGSSYFYLRLSAHYEDMFTNSWKSSAFWQPIPKLSHNARPY